MGGLDGRSTALASIGGASPTLQLGVGGFAEEIATVGYRLSVKDRILANVRKGFRFKRLPQSRGSFAMTVRNGPYPNFPRSGF